MRASTWKLALATACAFAMARRGFAEETPESGYVLGGGYAIPDTNWHLGGYGTATFGDPQGEGDARLAVDNLSLFLWWEGEGRWKFFSEFEYENSLSSGSNNRFEDDYLSWERAYLDYALTDSVSLRAGKFLTPIGHWNLVHATPLVWTTSRPLTTLLAFPTNMTGVMATTSLPSLGNGVDVSVYASGGQEIRPNPDLDPFSSAIGAHVTYYLGGESQIGFSYADFEQEKSRPERKQIAGVDFLWSHERVELSGEAIYRSSDFGASYDERGAFVQLVVPLSQKLYGVGRWENFRLAGDPATTRLWVGGLNYRIRPTIVLKAEWIEARHDTEQAPDGFLASISVLL